LFFEHLADEEGVLAHQVLVLSAVEFEDVEAGAVRCRLGAVIARRLGAQRCLPFGCDHTCGLSYLGGGGALFAKHQLQLGAGREGFQNVMGVVDFLARGFLKCLERRAEAME
jgi:hypothetical protein